VLASVFLVLILLLRRFVVPLYLLLSVLFSYYTTLGVSFAVFWLLDPQGFAGIDWRVAIFLFTILIAVGEDYNIFLMTRVREEEQRHGPVRGVTEALDRTGPIISSCGIIMAGTFASLLAGSLTQMKQLGFALAFGVLLDTFIVRPILVPSFLILLRTGRFSLAGKATKGADAPSETPDSELAVAAKKP
jgi:RND superfamily putative drug exporter